MTNELNVTAHDDIKLFEILKDGCDFDTSEVPKHGKGYVTPTASYNGVNYTYSMTLTWDYSWGIEEWFTTEGSWVVDNDDDKACYGSELSVITASKTEMATVIETGQIAVIKQIIENGNIDPILGYFEDKLKDLLSANLDPNDKNHRKEMRSFAASIGKSKKPITEMAMDTRCEIEAKAAHYLEAIDGVKSESKRFEKRMNEIRDEAKAPAIKWDADESIRTTAHQDKIAYFKAMITGIDSAGGFLQSSILSNTLDKFIAFKDDKMNVEVCEEYLPEYEMTVNDAIEKFTNEFVPQAIQREKDDAELQVLRDDKKKSDAKDLADENLRITALQAKKDLADEKLRGEKREAQLKMDALHSEAIYLNIQFDNKKQAKIDADSAEKSRLAGIEQAKIDTARDIKLEKDRLQKEADKKSANTENQRTKNNEALDDMVSLGYTRDEAITFLKRIAGKKIRNVTINY